MCRLMSCLLLIRVNQILVNKLNNLKLDNLKLDNLNYRIIKSPMISQKFIQLYVYKEYKIYYWHKGYEFMNSQLVGAVFLYFYFS